MIPNNKTFKELTLKRLWPGEGLGDEENGCDEPIINLLKACDEENKQIAQIMEKIIKLRMKTWNRILNLYKVKKH